MMVRLLLYGYATGVYSSRKIQARTYEDIAFRFLSGDQHPDHATIAEFRKRHLTALAGREQEERHTGMRKRGRKPQPPDPDQARPADKAQRNFTDPESRIMPDGANKGSFVQAYNAQIAADSASQVIVAAEVTQETTDSRQLLPMLAQIEKNLNRSPRKPAPTQSISARRM